MAYVGDQIVNFVILGIKFPCPKLKENYISIQWIWIVQILDTFVILVRLIIDIFASQEEAITLYCYKFRNIYIESTYEHWIKETLYQI